MQAGETLASSANTVTDHPREECRPVSLGQGLVIPIDLPLPPRRPTGVSHKSKSKILQSSIKVPEPRNSALLFRAYILDQGILPDNKFCNHQACVSVIIGALWRMLSEEERDIFARLAELEKQEHKKNHPEWRYIPGPRKPGLKSPHKIEIDSPPWKTVALQIARLIRTGVRGDDLAAQINIMVAEIGPNNMSPRKRKRPRYTVDEVPSMSKGSIKHQVLFSPPRRKPIAASGPHSADTAKMRVVPTPVYVEEAPSPTTSTGGSSSMSSSTAPSPYHSSIVTSSCDINSTYSSQLFDFLTQDVQPTTIPGDGEQTQRVHSEGNVFIHSVDMFTLPLDSTSRGWQYWESHAQALLVAENQVLEARGRTPFNPYSRMTAHSPYISTTNDLYRNPW